MKALIWIGCVIIYSIARVLIVYSIEYYTGQNFLLGAIPSAILAVLFGFTAHKLCKLYDAHKAKSAPPSESSDETGNGDDGDDGGNDGNDDSDNSDGNTIFYFR